MDAAAPDWDRIEKLLVEVEPCLSGIDAPFADDLALWTGFRDDSAHMIDRAHRVSAPGQNHAVMDASEYGYDPGTLGFERDKDEIYTGPKDRLPFVVAVRRS